MKITIGLTEKITFLPQNITVVARIDTGATKSSLDSALAHELKLTSIDKRTVKSAEGKSVRPIVQAKIKFAEKIITAKFTVADRKHMKYCVLVGQNILKKGGFLIDPDKVEGKGDSI